MRIVDAHIHYMVGPKKGPHYDPRILIDSGVVQQAWVLSANGFTDEHATDDEVLEVCRKLPDYLVPFGFLDFRKGPEQVERLHRAGFVGL